MSSATGEVLPPELIHRIVLAASALARNQYYEVYPVRKKGLANCASTCRYWAQLLRGDLFSRLRLRTAQDIVEFIDLWRGKSISGVLPISECLKELDLYDDTKTIHTTLEKCHLLALHGILVQCRIYVSPPWDAETLAPVPYKSRFLPVFSLPRSFPSSVLLSQTIEIIALHHLQLPSFKDLIRCIYSVRPRHLILDNVIFVKDDIDAYTAPPPPRRDRTRPFVGCVTYIKGDPQILHSSSYCKFLALLYAHGDADTNRARALAAQNLLRLLQCVAGDNPDYRDDLCGELHTCDKYRDTYCRFRGTVSCHAKADITCDVDEQTGLVDFHPVLIYLYSNLGQGEGGVGSATLLDFDALDRLLTEIESAATPSIYIIGSEYGDDIEPLLRCILDDEHPYTRALARLCRTRRVSLVSGHRIVDTLRELLPAALQSSVAGWQSMMRKDRLRINWIFEVLKRTWSAEDSEAALRALDPPQEAVWWHDRDSAEDELAGQSGMDEEQPEDAEGEGWGSEDEQEADEA
ncbi:hypothetical protein PsYK624_100320 [Phanerochaete sordida]|uniref:Uncharacterized protein n=1 Tax=Phanerochaete sordida TaxID=48140 RepID=A0A9P3LH86_9APHY|nr:hypothetical protein PsYK624_100320 [Phanerochaete sordida]